MMTRRDKIEEAKRRLAAGAGAVRAAPAPPRRTRPCVHEGAILEPCHSCSRAVADLRHVRWCDLHDRCTRGANRGTVASCGTCADYAPDPAAPAFAPAPPAGPPAHPTPHTPVPEVEALFRQPPRPWPAGWDGWPNVRRAFRNLFHEAAHHAPAPPRWDADRGVVICGGGWGFFPSVYVTVRILRHVGCRLPVQVWYLGDRGEFDPRMEAALRPYGVGWVDAHARWRDQPGVAIRRPTIDHGWMLKPFAAAFAPFREVVCLDADSYPAYDPERLLDHPEFRRVGACFWPDMNPLQRGQFERLGVRPPDRPVAFESGQFLVDKGRQWEPLWLTAWLNAHHEYVWGPGHRHLYGDKDTFYLAWLKLGREFCLPAARPGWSFPAFLQRGFDGHTAFVHRTRDKFRFFGEVDGHRVENRYHTAQAARDHQHFNPTLPHEPLAHALARACDRLIRADAHFDFGGSECVRDIWHRVRLWNEYELPPDLSGGRALDVGANVGAFAAACLDRGASVTCLEPHGPTADRLVKNLLGCADWAHRWTVDRRAAWAGGVSTVPLWLRADAAPGNSTLYTSLLGTGDGDGVGSDAVRVPTVPLDELIRTVRPALIKIDAEGAEWPALSTSERLGTVPRVIGEYHAATWDGRSWGPDELVTLLTARGFRVRVAEHDDRHGLFWAERDE